MGRKNSSARARNNRGRGGVMRHDSGEGTGLGHIILPAGRCTVGRPKARFATEADAQEALRQARSERARTGSGHAEKRCYECSCGGWHLTSRELFTP